MQGEQEYNQGQLHNAQIEFENLNIEMNRGQIKIYHNHQIDIEEIHQIQETVKIINKYQNNSYFQEVNSISQDHEFCFSEVYGSFLITLIYKLYKKQTIQIIKKKLLFKSEDKIYETKIYQDEIENHIEQIIEFVEKKFPKLYNSFQNKIVKLALLNIPIFNIFEQKTQLNKNHILFIKYCIKKNLQQISKQFFKFVNINLLVITFKDKQINQYENSFFLNIFYKLIHKYSIQLDDKEQFKQYFKSFKNYNKKLRSIESFRLEEAFILSLIHQGYQYILIRMLQSLSKKLYYDNQIFQKVIKRRMWTFINEFSKCEQFKPLLQNAFIFDKLFIQNDDDSFIIYQLQILKRIIQTFNLTMTSTQLENILQKFVDLFNDQEKLSSLHTNYLYMLCSISLILKQFNNTWDKKFDYFNELSIQYMEKADEIISGIVNEQTLYLILFQFNHLQESQLINILFQNIEHFRQILNKNTIFKMLDRLWCSNKHYSNNFMLETFSSQALDRDYSIILDNRPQTTLNDNTWFENYYQKKEENKNKNIINLSKYNKLKDRKVTIKQLESDKGYVQEQKMRLKSILDTDGQRKDLVQNKKKFKKGKHVEKNKEGSIFNYIKSDEHNFYCLRNFVYQQDIFLHNLKFKKLYDVVLFVITFIITLYQINNMLILLLPISIQYYQEPDLMTLINWKVPDKWNTSVRLNQTKYDNLKYLFSEADIKTKYDQNNLIWYCEQRVIAFDWLDSDIHYTTLNEDGVEKPLIIKDSYFEFCKQLLIFEELKYDGSVQIIVNVCVLNTILSFTSIIQIFYQILCHKKIVQFKISYWVDFLIIFLNNMLIYEHDQITKTFYFSEVHIQYLETIQKIGVSLLFLQYLRILFLTSIFKKIGIYLIIFQKIVSEITIFVSLLLMICYLISIFYDIASSLLPKGSNTGLIYKFLFTLGDISIYQSDSFVQLEQSNKDMKTLVFQISNLLSVAIAYIMMMLMNVLIAQLTNIYQKVVDSSESEFSFIIFQDYQVNIPNDYYSSIDNTPGIICIIQVILGPITYMLKSKKFNHVMNFIFYVIKFLIPFMLIYVVANFALIPFVYVKILYCIAKGKYQNQMYVPVVISRKRQTEHFVQFLLFGGLYLLFKILFLDLIYIVKKSQKEVTEDFNLIFNKKFYKLFKKAVYHFIYTEKKDSIDIEEFNQFIYNNYHWSLKNDQQSENEILTQFQKKLSNYAEHDNNQIDLLYFQKMLIIMKNKKILLDQTEDYLSQQKMIQMEIIIDRYS